MGHLGLEGLACLACNGIAILSTQHAQRIVVNVTHVLFSDPDDGAAASPDLGDMSPEGPQPPMILLQQLLASATQPSPVKAIFDKQELEVPQCPPPLGPLHSVG